MPEGKCYLVVHTRVGGHPVILRDGENRVVYDRPMQYWDEGEYVTLEDFGEGKVAQTSIKRLLRLGAIRDASETELKAAREKRRLRELTEGVAPEDWDEDVPITSQSIADARAEVERKVAEPEAEMRAGATVAQGIHVGIAPGETVTLRAPKAAESAEEVAKDVAAEQAKSSRR